MARPKKRAGAGSSNNAPRHPSSRSSRASSGGKSSLKGVSPFTPKPSASPTPFSMRDEASFTERNPSHWASRNLRHSRVNFVSAGNLEPDMDVLHSTAQPGDDRFTPESTSTVDAWKSFARDNLALANGPSKASTGADAWKAFARNKLAHVDTSSYPGFSKGSPVVIPKVDTKAAVDARDVDLAYKTPSRSEGSATEQFLLPGADPLSDHEQDPVEHNDDAGSSGVKGDTAETSCPFFVDTAGETPSITIPAHHHTIRTPSPTPSISSSADEIVFRGRCNMTRAFVNPFSPNSHEPALPSTRVDPPPQEPATNIPCSDHPASSEPAALKPLASSPGIEGSPVKVESHKSLILTSPVGEPFAESNYAGVSDLAITSKQHVDSWVDHGEDWVHRSKPGHGWTRPRGKARPKAAWELLLTEEDHDEIYAEFVQTANECTTPEHAKLPLPDQPTTPASVGQNGSLDTDGPAFLSHDMPISGTNNPQASGVGGSVADELELLDSEDEPSEESEEEISNGERQDEQAGRGPTYDDENFARLLQKQEMLGLGFDHLALFDGAVEDDIMDRDHDYLDGKKREDDVSDAAILYLRNAPKTSKRRRNIDSFPSASALADAVEQDPYNGFDVMDFERPSLRQKAKSKAPQIDMSDEELEAQLQSTWQKDREKKKKRKQAREELRALGMLGSKSKSKSPKDKLFEGMSLVQVREELRKFLSSTNDIHALPPMDKVRRKMVHEIAGKFGIKSNSSGSGTNRYITLVKTSRTLAFDDEAFAGVAKTVKWGFFPRSAAPRGPGGKSAGKAKIRAAGDAGVMYRDGEVVGAAAPEIGSENRGRSMLEKMGWRAGTALGAMDNKGILQPITHVVKNTRAGLG